MRVVALLVAAGRGQRFGAAEPKQFLSLSGRPVLRHAAEALLADGLVEAVLPVCSAGEEARVSGILDGLPVLPPVQGGLARQDSVRAGLEALAADPPVLLMDEPFSALDPSIRRSLQREMRAIHARTGKTILFVTHDVEEALTLADQLAVLRDGKLVASGTPTEVLEQQADGAVRELLGEEALAFHRLATLPAHRRARVETGAEERDLPLLPADATLKQALLLMLDQRTDRLALETAEAGPPHILHLGDLLSPATAGDRTPS